MELGFESQPADGNVFQCLEQIAVALQQQRLVRAVEIYDDLGGFQIVRANLRRDVHAIAQVKTPGSQDRVETVTNFSGGGFAV